MEKNTKRINLDQWTMLGKYNYARPCFRKLCTYTLTKVSDTRYRRDQYISLPFYLILFLPMSIIQAVWCVWDGGLKEFEFPSRYLGGDYLWECDCGELIKKFYGE